MHSTFRQHPRGRPIHAPNQITSAAAGTDKEAHNTLLFLPHGSSWWQQFRIRFLNSGILDNSKSRDS